MRRSSNNYTAYSIACFVVWAVILAVVALIADSNKARTFVLGVFRLGDRVVVRDDRQACLSTAQGQPLIAACALGESSGRYQPAAGGFPFALRGTQIAFASLPETFGGLIRLCR